MANTQMASQTESSSPSQSTIKSLKKGWLKSVTNPSSTSTSTSIHLSLINPTLSPISRSDPIWTCNAILDFLSQNQDSQNLTVSIDSLGSLIDLGLHITQSSSNQNGWEHLKVNDSETELLSIRYHLVAYQRLLLAWEKLYSSQLHLQTQHHPQAGRVDATPQSQIQDQEDPWDQVEDEYSNQISTHKTAETSSSLNQVQSSSSSTTLFPFSSIQPFLNSTPLQSFLSILMGNGNSDSSIESPSEIIDEMVGFLENLHLKLKVELFENRFKLIDLIIRILCLDSDQEDGNQDWILQRLIDVRLLPTLDQHGVETSIWNLESNLRQLNHQESVDDPNLIRKLIDLELIESKDDGDVGLETIVGTPSNSPSLLLEFYREEITSLQLDYGHDSLNLCLHLSNWISTFINNSINNKDPEDWNKRLGKELLALNLLNDNDSSSRNLENFREAIRSKKGRIEILKDYLIEKNSKSRIGRDSNWDQFFNLLESISELGQDRRNQDKILEAEISVNPSYDSVINFPSSIPTSTELFLQLILELVSRSPTTLTPTSSFTITTQLLKVNHRNEVIQISNDLEINLILSLLLGHSGGKDSETLESFKTLNQVLINFQDDGTSDSQDESLQTLVNFLKPYKLSKSNPNSLVIDLLNDPTSPLSISNLGSKESGSQSISRRISKLLKCSEMLLKWQKVIPSSKVEIPKSLNEILLISLDLKEQNRLVKSICSKDYIVHIGQSSRGESWFELLNDLMTLRNEEFGLLRLMGGKEIVKIWFGGILSTGDFEMSKQLHQQLLRKIPSEFTLDDEELEALVLKRSRDFYDSSDSLNLHRGSMKLAYDCLSIIPSTSIIKKEKAFIEATSKLSTFQLPSSTSSSSFGPSKLTSKEIRLASDRLTFISLLLSSKPEIYKSSEMILDLGWKLSNTPVSKDQPEDEEVEEVLISKPLIEIKCLAMLIDSSIANEDLLEGYDLSQRLVEKISEMRKRAQSMIKNQDKENIDVNHSAKDHKTKKMNSNSAIDLLPIVEEIGWKSCYQLCKHPAWGEEEEEVEDGESEEIKDGEETHQTSENESIKPNNRPPRQKASKDPDVSKRLKLMSQVISLCPKNQLATFLERWRTLDKEHFQISLQQDYLSKNNLGNSYSSRLNSKFLTESLGKASDLSFISPFSSLFNSSALSSQLSFLGGSASGLGGGAKVATKPKANAPSGGFGKAAQLFDGFGDSSNRNTSGSSTATSSSPWDYANVAIDPAERAARAARNFFGGFGNSPVLGSASWTGSNSDTLREGSGEGNGENERERSRDVHGSRNVSGASGFSFTRGMGWLMGEEER